jgi:hypothetical protein
MSDLFKGERLYTEAEMLAAIKRALEGAANMIRDGMDDSEWYNPVRAIRAMDSAQFIEEPKKEMTNEELVKQLCDLGQYEAANRIEELEFFNEQLRDERDWYRERVVWGFYEDEEPEYYQGKEGESEICDSVTAKEVTRLLQGWTDTEAKLAKAVDETLDAASAYMKKQYGIEALSHPVDRARIIAELKGANP